MTRRILLTLADDTTATECGACPARLPFECALFGGYSGPQMMTRAPACIAAEAAAARMVEIAPEDAAAWSRSRGVMMPSTSDYDTATQVEAAIVAHGKAAR